MVLSGQPNNCRCAVASFVQLQKAGGYIHQAGKLAEFSDFRDFYCHFREN
jgi:hypothetical protein